MTNLGGPGFVFLVLALFVTAATPLMVGAAIVLIRSGRMPARRAFLVSNGVGFASGLLLIFAWTLPGFTSGASGFALQVLGIYVGTALGIIVLLELVPIWCGTVVFRRWFGVEPESGVVFVGIGWFVGAIVGIGIAAIIAPAIVAAVGAIPGAILGTVVLGPLLYRFAN